VRVNYGEIYNEQINDLLAPNMARLRDPSQPLTEEVCTNID